jgi:mono/diheme cytochrome c family protein
MPRNPLMAIRILAVVLVLAAIVAAESGNNASGNKSTESNTATAANTVPSSTAQSAAIRDEGEKRFRTNCGRCHMAPHKFPPRMMATFVRHMRVRALITDEDMRYILAYMTE